MIFESLNTITEDLLRIIRGSDIASTEPISRRQVENWVHQYRSVLISRDIDKKYYVNPDYVQEISFLGLIPSTIEGGMYETELELPITIDLNYKSGFTWIGDTNGIEYQYMPQKRKMWQQYKRYTANDAIVFLKDHKLYTNKPENISVRGVFENPMEVGRFTNPNTNLPYTNGDSRYPVPNNLVPTLKEMILQGELQIEATAPSDKSNNNEHDLNNQ